MKSSFFYSSFSSLSLLFIVFSYSLLICSQHVTSIPPSPFLALSSSAYSSSASADPFHRMADAAGATVIVRELLPQEGGIDEMGIIDIGLASPPTLSAETDVIETNAAAGSEEESEGEKFAAEDLVGEVEVDEDAEGAQETGINETDAALGRDEENEEEFGAEGLVGGEEHHEHGGEEHHEHGGEEDYEEAMRIHELHEEDQKLPEKLRAKPFHSDALYSADVFNTVYELHEAEEYQYYTEWPSADHGTSEEDHGTSEEEGGTSEEEGGTSEEEGGTSEEEGGTSEEEGGASEEEGGASEEEEEDVHYREKIIPKGVYSVCYARDIAQLKERCIEAQEKGEGVYIPMNDHENNNTRFDEEWFASIRELKNSSGMNVSGIFFSPPHWDELRSILDNHPNVFDSIDINWEDKENACYTKIDESLREAVPKEIEIRYYMGGQDPSVCRSEEGLRYDWDLYVRTPDRKLPIPEFLIPIFPCFARTTGRCYRAFTEYTALACDSEKQRYMFAPNDYISVRMLYLFKDLCMGLGFGLPPHDLIQVV